MLVASGIEFESRKNSTAAPLS